MRCKQSVAITAAGIILITSGAVTQAQDVVVSDGFEPVSARTMKLPLMPR